MEQNSLKAIKALKDKGEKITVAGHTGSGKTNLLNSLALNDKVREILKLRTGKGKGSLTETEIYVTNHPDIAEDSLYVTGKFKKVYEDDLFSGKLYNYVNNLLLRGFRDCKKAEDNAFETVKNGYKAYIKTAVSSNDDLKAMLQKIAIEVDGKEVSGNAYLIQQIINYLEDNTDCFSYLLDKYHQWKDSNSKDKEGFWRNLLNVKDITYPQDLEEEITKQIKNLFDTDLKSFKDEIEANGGTTIFEGNIFDFGIALKKSTNEKIEASRVKKIEELLLNSENKSREYFIDEFSLYFRGRDDLWEENTPNLSRCVCTKYKIDNKEQEVYLLHFVDTMGLYHAEGVKKADEKNRIYSILSKYNSKILVLIHSSLEDAIVKSAKDMEVDLLEEYEITKFNNGKAKLKKEEDKVEVRTLSVFPVFTKVDLGVYDEITSKNTGKRVKSKDREEALKVIVRKNKEVLDKLYLAENNLVYMYGLRGDNKIYKLLRNCKELNLEDGTVLDIGSMTLLEQSKKLVQDILGVMSEKILITAQQEEQLKDLHKLGININVNINANSVSAYIDNLEECKNRPYLHHNTVEASVKNWLQCRQKHESDAKKYQNIKTFFVLEVQRVFLPTLIDAFNQFKQQSNKDNLAFNDTHKNDFLIFWLMEILHKIYNVNKADPSKNKTHRELFNALLCNCSQSFGQSFFDVNNSQEIEDFLKSTYTNAADRFIKIHCIK